MAATISKEALTDPSIAQALYSDSFERYIDLWDLMHSNIEFWVAVTFSAIVAIHFLGSRVTRGLKVTIVGLYLAFSLHILILVLNILYQITSHIEIGLAAATALGIEFEATPIGNIGLVWLACLFFGGTIVTTSFILRSDKYEPPST